MPRAIGANSKLHMAVETEYGTSPGGNWRLMPFVSCDLGAEQPFIDADVIGLAPNRDVAPPFRDVVTVQGQAVVPVDLEFIGDWLTLLLGPPTSSGADPDFENVFVSGASPLPSASIELAYPDVPNFDVIAGVRADTCEIDFSPSGAATATVGLIGQGSTRSAASSAGTPTTRDYVAFNKAQGAIRRNGALLAQITGGRLNYSNGGRDRPHHPRRPEDRGCRSRSRPRRPTHHRHAARDLPRARQDADPGVRRHRGRLRVPRRLQHQRRTDDDRHPQERRRELRVSVSRVHAFRSGAGYAPPVDRTRARSGPEAEPQQPRRCRDQVVPDRGTTPRSAAPAQDSADRCGMAADAVPWPRRH